MGPQIPTLLPATVGWLLGLFCAGASALPSSADALPWQPSLALASLAGGIALAVWGFARSADPARPLRQSWPGVVAAGLSVVAGFAAGPRTPSGPPLPPAGMARMEVEVERARVGVHGGSAVVRVLNGRRLSDGAEIPRGTRLRAGPVPLQAGARLRLLARIRPELPFRNPTPHPPLPEVRPVTGRAYLAGPEAARVLQAAPVTGLTDALRRRVRRALSRSLPPRAAGLARALVVGDGDAVAAEDRARVREAGLSHVLAVSGLHVAILVGLFVMLLRQALALWPALALRVDVARVASALGIAAALLFANFAGGASSAYRAAITAAIAFGLHAGGRRPHAASVACAAVLTLSAVEPQRATEPGFLLSIVATAAVIAAVRDSGDDLGSWLQSALRVSLQTTLATAPIVLWCFGQLPVVGVLANVVLLPIGSLLLLPLAALHALLATVLPWTPPTALPLSLLSDAFINACALFAELLPAITWPVPDLAQGLTLVVAVATLLWVRGLRARLALLLLACLALGGLELWLRARERPEGILRATFVDVGQGDAALVDLPDGRLMLVDAGGNPGGGPDPGARALLPLLEARRRERVDIAVLSHPHPDHYGGLAALMDAGIAIGELWDSGQAENEVDLSPTAAEASELLARARGLGVRIRKPDTLCDRPLKAGGARVEVLAPCPGYDSGHDANDNSLVLRVVYGKRSMLFAGDAERHAEAVMLERGLPLAADLLKVGHHGSRTSTTAPFLAAVHPRIAIISAGAGNRFGHPHAQVHERLLAKVPEVLNLADSGGVEWRSDGRGMELRSWSGVVRRWP
ncbi:MAG: DNA internalization-related competence protein ComEC/Rec2 [Myxococcales bacterium]|nr:DNA internalization-related competence protein ComEC/Rec2 [Myxococcales bacterium]